MNRRRFLQGAGAGAATLSSALGRAQRPTDAVGPVTSVDVSTVLNPVPESGHPLVSFCNPLQGVDSTPAVSRGGTLPIIAMPFAMAHWALQTTNESPWFFNPHDRRTQGIRCTHQLSPWLDDYGHATFLPFSGAPKSLAPAARSASYRVEQLQLSPHALHVVLPRYQCTVELAPTEHGCLLRLTFAESGPAGLAVDLNSTDAEVSPAANGALHCLTRVNHGGVLPGFASYYLVATDDVPFQAESLVEGKSLVAVLRFTAEAGKPIVFRISTSFIGAGQAAHNAEVEFDKSSFDSVRTAAANAWETLLSRVRIQGASAEESRTFYSCLYRTLLYPRIWHEPAPGGGVHHRSPYTGEVVPGVMYADHGYWDDYHAWYPMMTLLYPDRLSEILQAWVNTYREGGWLPQFPSPGYRAAMTGSLIDSVFGEAVAKGITGFDVKLAYAALKKHATQPGDPSKGYGRKGLELYLKYGYVPCDAIRDGVVETLDSAYGDFCIAQVAEAAGETADAARFRERSHNWRNLFDPRTKFIRGKLTDGAFAEPFDPILWGDPYVEGSAWQYRFAPLHDIPHLMELHGGPAPFVEALEEMLRTPPNFRVGSYGEELHEMAEMAAANFGQYAHSNQPVHNFLYLFSVAGRRDRTEYWVHRVLRELYTSENFPGDEDTGAMSAWYVLSSLGLFAQCPGKSEWTLGAPLFPSAVVTTPRSELHIEVRRADGSAAPLSRVELNGKQVTSSSVPNESLLGKASLVFSA